jgi:hypothetical protein
MVWLNENCTAPAEGTQMCRAGGQWFTDKTVPIDKLCKMCIHNGTCQSSELFRKTKQNKKLSGWI